MHALGGSLATLLIAGCYQSHPPDVPCMPGEPCDCRAALPIPSGPGWVGASGDENDWPLHELVLTREVWIGTYEITAGCYRRCVAAAACVDPRDHVEFELQRDASPDVDSLGPGYFEDSRTAELPMVPLSRTWAAAYCEWLGGRLPTNGEWERAARGVEGRYNPWSPIPEDPASPPGRAGTCDEFHYANRTVDPARCWHTPFALLPVGTFPPGVYGHYDLMGDPLEWVSDWYAPYPEGSVVDYAGPSTPTEAGIRRGGGAGWDRLPDELDPALTQERWPQARLLGARCAFDAQPVPMP